MSGLSEIVKRHKPTCASFHDFSWKCNCGADEAAVELAAKDAEIATLREWKQAIDDACTVDWLEATTPKETIQKLISINVQQALDPAISEQPAKWVARIAELEAMIDAIRLETQSVCPVPYGGAIYRIIEIIGEAQ